MNKAKNIALFAGLAVVLNTSRADVILSARITGPLSSTQMAPINFSTSEISDTDWVVWSPVSWKINTFAQKKNASNISQPITSSFVEYSNNLLGNFTCDASDEATGITGLYQNGFKMTAANGSATFTVSNLNKEGTLRVYAGLYGRSTLLTATIGNKTATAGFTASDAVGSYGLGWIDIDYEGLTGGETLDITYAGQSSCFDVKMFAAALHAVPEPTAGSLVGFAAIGGLFISRFKTRMKG